MRKTIEIDPTFDLTHWFLGQAYEDRASSRKQSLSGKPRSSVPIRLFRLARPGLRAGGEEGRTGYSTT
jgi:hypothetical protein